MNQEDFTRVYDAHYPRVFHYLRWRLRDADAAELLAAEVFATALTSWQNGAKPTLIGSWLVRIADHLASQKSRGTRVEQRADESAPVIEPDPEELALGKLDSQMIWRCVDMLSAEHRQVLLLRVVAGLSAREVGELIGNTEQAVRGLQFRALLELRALSREAEVRAGRSHAAR